MRIYFSPFLFCLLVGVFLFSSITSTTTDRWDLVETHPHDSPLCALTQTPTFAICGREVLLVTTFSSLCAGVTLSFFVVVVFNRFHKVLTFNTTGISHQ